MINRLVLKAGTHPGGSQQAFAPGPMTVFVGPNNSGKSLMLREILPARFQEFDSNSWSHLVHDVNLDEPGYLKSSARHLVERTEVVQ
jgi:ABC-type hemin transport system ATPase subunit